MNSRRVTKSAVDWAAFAARVPEEQQIQLKAFKTRHDTYLSKVMSYPENPPKIDWESYKKRIPIAGLVDQFQKQMASVKVNYPQDNLSSTIDQQEQEALGNAKRFIQDSNQRIEKLRIEAKQWEDMMPLHKMTTEEWILEFPDNAHGLDQKRYQTLYPHDYDPKSGLIPGEKGSGAWNIGGPDRHLEDKDGGH